MNSRINISSILFEKYINRIIELVDFTLLEEEKSEKEKIIIKILVRLYKDLIKNRISSPEYIHIYKIAIKELLKARIKIKDIDIKKLKNFYNIFNSIDYDLIKKSVNYLEPEDRFILILTHKHKITAKELSLILNKTEGYIYSSLIRTKNFILDFYKKENNTSFKIKACFFIENHFERFKQNFLKENKKIEISNHIETCSYCSNVFNNIYKIDILLSEFTAQSFNNILEKTYIIINKKFNLNNTLRIISKSWITKSSLSLTMLILIFYNLKLPEFNFIEFEKLTEDKINKKNPDLAFINNETFPIIDEILELEESEESEENKETLISLNTSLNSEPEYKNSEMFGPYLEDINKISYYSNETAYKTKKEEKAPIEERFVYKFTTISNKWQEIDAKLFTNIEKHKAVQAGNLALGSESNAGSYYHMYIDIDKLEAFIKDINLISSFNFIKEPETRSIPDSKARMVIWIGRN